MGVRAKRGTPYMMPWRVMTEVVPQVLKASAQPSDAACISAWVEHGVRVTTSMVALEMYRKREREKSAGRGRQERSKWQSPVHFRGGLGWAEGQGLARGTGWEAERLTGLWTSIHSSVDDSLNTPLMKLCVGYCK